MTDFIPVSRRTEGLGYWGLAPTAAIAIAPAVGMHVHHFGWFALCAELAVLSALMALWAARLPGGERPDAIHDGTVEMASRPRVIDLWDFRVLKTALSFAVVSFGYGGITSVRGHPLAGAGHPSGVALFTVSPPASWSCAS